MHSKPNALLNLQPLHNPEDDTVSSSVPRGDIATYETYVPSVDQAKAMTAEELHKSLLASLVGTLVCYAAAKVLAVAAKLRMQNGEAVGGCLTFTGPGGYVDKYLRRKDQSLEAAVRASYRLLDGLGISEKFDGSEARAAKKKAAEEKAQMIADKKEAAEARRKLDDKVQQAKALKEKTNAEVVEAAFEKQKTVTHAEIVAEAAKMQRPLVQQLETAERKIKDAAKIADRKSKADVAAEDLVHYILQNVTSSGTASVATAKKIYELAAKFRLCQKGEAT